MLKEEAITTRSLYWLLLGKGQNYEFHNVENQKEHRKGGDDHNIEKIY